MKTSRTPAGFTIVELIVTIVIAGIFVGVIANMSGAIITISVSAHRFEMASNLAYNNLRLYANGQPPRWFICNGDDTSDNENSDPYSDGAKHPDATGQILVNSTSTSMVNDLPPPVVQLVSAVAPYGCGNTISGMPVRIVSTVTYGSPAKKVIHATYVGY